MIVGNFNRYRYSKWFVQVPYFQLFKFLMPAILEYYVAIEYDFLQDIITKLFYFKLWSRWIFDKIDVPKLRYLCINGLTDVTSLTFWPICIAKLTYLTKLDRIWSRSNQATKNHGYCALRLLPQYHVLH